MTMWTKLGIYAIVLALLVGLVVAGSLSDQDTNPSDDAIAGVAFSYVECAAYYQVTADVLQRDADEEFAGQYRERAGLALDAGAALSGRSVLEMAKDQKRLANRLAEWPRLGPFSEPLQRPVPSPTRRLKPDRGDAQP